MRSFGLMLARIALAAWVGAAVLFVVAGVREVRWPHFDSVTRDMLVIIRFPPYYAFAFALNGTAWLGTLAARSHPALPRRGATAALALLTVVLLLTAADYFFVYAWLADAVTPPGQARPPRFEAYHNASMWLNALALLLCLTAAVLLNWPRQAAAGHGERPA